MGETKRSFDAVAKREGRWWIITVPELGAVTQARHVREIDDMACGLISALLDVDEKAVSVAVSLRLPDDVSEAWEEAGVLHEQAVIAEKRAAILRRQAVRQLLTDSGMSQRDAAAALGLSSQRVQQLAQ